MDAQAQAEIVGRIHDSLLEFKENRIKLRANMGRSKIIERQGVLTQVHPQLFIVEVEERRGRKARQSYQHVDILTGTVELYYEDTLDQLLPWLFEEKI